MAYDEVLSERIRELVDGEPELTVMTMFGGLAFLVAGNMAVAASGQGGLLVRVDRARSAVLVEREGVSLMQMRGRSMQGWLRVDPSRVGTVDQLAEWVELGVAYARTLPPKR